MAAAEKTLVTAISVIEAGSRPARCGAVAMRERTSSSLLRRSNAFPSPPADCQIDAQEHRDYDHGLGQILMHLRGSGLPAVAEEVAERKEAEHPGERAGVGKCSEDRILQARRAGDHGGEVSNAGDVVAEEQTPSSGALETGVDLLESLLRGIGITNGLVNQ